VFIFEIHGAPVPQKQTRFSCIHNKPHTWDPSKKDKQQIQWQIKPFAPSIPLSGPIELTIAFFLPIPKSTSKAKRQQMLNRVILPDIRPDEDNLAYLVTNALKEIVYHDDKQICAKHVYKFYGAEGKTIIKVRPILQAEELGYRNADDL
jgi:Holliday junction resolvase RusA-like endonuclease